MSGIESVWVSKITHAGGGIPTGHSDADIWPDRTQQSAANEAATFFEQIARRPICRRAMLDRVSPGVRACPDVARKVNQLQPIQCIAAGGAKWLPDCLTRSIRPRGHRRRCSNCHARNSVHDVCSRCGTYDRIVTQGRPLQRLICRHVSNRMQISEGQVAGGSSCAYQYCQFKPGSANLELQPLADR